MAGRCKLILTSVSVTTQQLFCCYAKTYTIFFGWRCEFFGFGPTAMEICNTHTLLGHCAQRMLLSNISLWRNATNCSTIDTIVMATIHMTHALCTCTYDREQSLIVDVMLYIHLPLFEHSQARSHQSITAPFLVFKGLCMIILKGTYCSVRILK